MASRTSGEASDNEHYLTLLDDLIVREYGRLLEPEDKNVRMGDFLKMIELRHKLTPPGADQREFWATMDRIRRDVLASGDPVGRKPVKSARSGKMRKSRRGKAA